MVNIHCNFLYFFTWFPNGLLTKTNCFYTYHSSQSYENRKKGNPRHKNPEFRTFGGHPRRGVRLVLLDPQHVHDTQSPQVCPQNHHFTGLQARRKEHNCIIHIKQMQLVFHQNTKYSMFSAACTWGGRWRIQG